MTWVYKRTEPELWTVGYYDPNGRWCPDSDWNTPEEAAERAAHLNGAPAPDPESVDDPPVDENTSDGFHTFRELYEHRDALFCAVLALLAGHVTTWKSLRHEPGAGPMFDGRFIAGAELPGVGQVSYHPPLDWWDRCPAPVVEHGLHWDGYTPDDVVQRLVTFALSWRSWRQEHASWPYDAIQDHPLTSRRIPVIPTLDPQWRYEVALVIGGNLPHLTGVEPTDTEVTIIESLIAYRRSWYTSSHQQKMLTRQFDVDATTNPLVLLKTADGGWHYRWASWTRGLPVVPPTLPADGEPVQTLSLVEVIDRALVGVRTWETWKAQHPDLFTAEDSAS